MTRIIVNELVLDEANREHIVKHNVRESEIVTAGSHLIYHTHTYSGRYLMIGWSGSRLLTLILKRVGPCKYYVVTARDASKKERKKVYEKEKK